MKNNFIKFFLPLIVALFFCSSATSVMGAHEITIGEATNGVLATFEPAKTNGTWDEGKPRVAGADKKSLVLEEDNAGNIGGFIAKGMKEGVYKVGYYFTLDTVEESDKRVRFKPHGEDLYFNIGYSDLLDYEGQKIIIVTLVRTKDNENLEVGLWKDRGISGTLDKIVLATADYNFIPNSPGYELVAEDAPQDIEPGALAAGYENVTEDEWTPSEAAATQTTPPAATATPAETTAPTETTAMADTTAPAATASPATQSPAATLEPGDDGISAGSLVAITIIILAVAGAIAYFVIKNKRRY